MPKKLRGFDNSIYVDAADAYHDFVSHYDLSPFMLRLNSVFSAASCYVLELGAGAGIFTAPLSDLASSVDAVEYHDDQLKKLKDHIDRKSIGNVEIITGDANKPYEILEKTYDKILFSFSLDNILGTNVYTKFNVAAHRGLISSYAPFLKPNGQFIIIGSMPENTITSERKGIYERYRDEQFSFFEEYSNCNIEVFDYLVRFPDHDHAMRATSAITSMKVATEMLGSKSSDIQLKAYVAKLSLN